MGRDSDTHVLCFHCKPLFGRLADISPSIEFAGDDINLCYLHQAQYYWRKSSSTHDAILSEFECPEDSEILVPELQVLDLSGLGCPYVQQRYNRLYS